MNDKEYIIDALSEHGTKIAKVIFPGLPQRATETLIRLGLNNQVDKSNYGKMLNFLFDENGNLPSPDEFWEVFKSVLNDKPVVFNVFNQQIKINGDDITEVMESFNKLKNA